MIDLQPKRIAVDVNTSESGTRHHVPSDLAIADRVVQMHNGTIRASNAHDGGLIVEIVLPLT